MPRSVGDPGSSAPPAGKQERTGSGEARQRALGYGSANAYSIPPFVVAWGKSFIALTNPNAALESRTSSPPATTAPAQPPTPDMIATYSFPSGPRYTTGSPMMPEPVLNCHSCFPVWASTALNQPSIVP